MPHVGQNDVQGQQILADRVSPTHVSADAAEVPQRVDFVLPLQCHLLALLLRHRLRLLDGIGEATAVPLPTNLREHAFAAPREAHELVANRRERPRHVNHLCVFNLVLSLQAQ